MSLTYAIATPSYAGDVERCRLLCASVDRFVSGHVAHYLLVEDRDVPLFRDLETPRRRVIAESDLLPSWLRSRPDPLSLGRRRVWTGARALLKGIPPLRGWHAQQLRKFALPLHSTEDVVLFADSDMLFLRPFELGSLVTDEGIRLYRKPAGITPDMPEHRIWCDNASALLGLPPPTLPGPDYINNMVSWRRDNVRALVAQLERASGRDWVRAIASRRAFSEYMIYGYFVEQVLGLGPSGHWADERELCKVYWGGKAGAIDSLRSFEEVMEPWQVAVGVQSFIGEPVEKIRALFETQ